MLSRVVCLLAYNLSATTKINFENYIPPFYRHIVLIVPADTALNFILPAQADT